MYQSTITLQINNNAFVKDPASTDLGKKIISGSIDLISELGFENFTFKKLSQHISSTEASVYRYFNGKHQLLAYLVLWYWSWQKYRLALRLTNIEDPKERLRRAIILLTERVSEDSTFSQINEIKLHLILISEASKVFLNKDVDKDNQLGYFTQYKEVVNRISEIILEINPSFKYPHMLVSTVIEGSHHQRFFAEHLPRLTNVIEGEDAVTSFYVELVFNEIEK
jgi:AcrR family transcriptional regulator